MLNNLESSNVPGHFVRHLNFLGELNQRDRNPLDFSFRLVSRGQGRVAFRSQNFSHVYLRHRDFRIHLEGPAGADDAQFQADSTFFYEHGLADRNARSFRSVNVPDRYLRHRDFHLCLEAPNGPDDQLFRQDATFFERPAAQLIDDNP